MSDNNSLKDFLHEALHEHDAGASFSGAPTALGKGSVNRQGMGSLPGHSVEGFIARGGMGAVYLARQQALEREVAVKVMTAEADSPEMAERFRREALVLGRLPHPNIVPVYDIGFDDAGQLFYTMKLVKGRTLQHILNDLRDLNGEALHTHTLASLLTVFRKVCDAIAFAHSQGIIHRDLKPENVMVGEFGEVLVMDWGLAKKLNESGEAPAELSQSSMVIRHSEFGGTLSGSVMGTPQYMSPEQAMGLVNELDARSDIFSLGGILYAILTLRPPVEGKTLDEVLNKVRTGNITSPSAFGATVRDGEAKTKGAVLEARKITPLPHIAAGKVPPALSAVVMKALRLDKAQRYQSVAEFSADIEAFQGGFATTAEHAGLAKQFALLINRHRGIFTTAAAAWLLITGLAVWFVLNLRAKELRAIEGEEAALVEKESARRSSATANLNLADAALREADSAGMQAALEAVPEDLRDSTWGYLLDQSDTSLARLRPSTTGEIVDVAAVPRQPGVFAVVDQRGRVTLITARTGVRLLEFATGFTEKSGTVKFCLAVSPDGERVAVGREEGGIVIHSTRDGKKLAEWKTGITQHLQFSSDGQLVLQRTRDQGARNSLVMWDSTNGQVRWKHASATGNVFGSFTPDGQQVVTVCRGEDVRLLTAQDGTLARIILDRFELGMTGEAKGMALGAADMFAVADSNGTVSVVKWREGRVLTRFQHEAAGSPDLSQIAWTPDGMQIVTAVQTKDGRQLIRLWTARTGSLMRSLLGGILAIKGIAVHPVSGELVVGGPASRTWSLTGVNPKWTLQPSGGAWIVFWGSDDVVIAPPSPNFPAAVQKLQPGGATVLWQPATVRYRSPSVSADGRWAALRYPSTQPTPLLLLRRNGDQVEQIDLPASARSDFVRLSPTGVYLTAFNRGEVEWFAVATGKKQPQLERGDIKRYYDLAWLTDQRLAGLVTANGDRLDPGTEERVVLWDATTGAIMKSVPHATAMDALAVAPDGTRLAEAGADKRVRIRDAATLAILHEFRAHDAAISALAWHPTRSILATASNDLSIRLWDLDSGRRLEELRGPPRAPEQLSFSPSGRRLSCAYGIWEPESLHEKSDSEKPDDWEDLLAHLTPATVTQTGNGWRMDNGVLFSPNKTNATLSLPGSLSGTSYQARVKLRQLTAKEVFHLALPVGDRMVGFELDGWPKKGHYTGMNGVDGKESRDLPGAVHGKQIKDPEQHDLEVTVRLAGANATITTTLDTRPLYQWTGPASTIHQSWKTPPGSLAIGTHAADWVVYEVKVKRL